MNAPDPRARLQEIQGRAAQALPGPWTSFIEGRDHLGGEDIIFTGTPNPTEASTHPAITIELQFPRPTATHKRYAAHDANQDFIAAARSDVPAMAAALQAVLDLHYPALPAREQFWAPGDYYYVCPGCEEQVEPAIFYNCPTVRAITAALTPGPKEGPTP